MTIKTYLSQLWKFVLYWHKQMLVGGTDDWRTWAAPWVITGLEIAVCAALCLVTLVVALIWVFLRDYVLPHL